MSNKNSLIKHDLEIVKDSITEFIDLELDNNIDLLDPILYEFTEWAYKFRKFKVSDALQNVLQEFEKLKNLRAWVDEQLEKLD